MPINHPVNKLLTLVLGGAAIAAAAQTSAQALSARPGPPAVNTAADGQGNPTAQPPILPPVPPSQRADIKRGEAQRQQQQQLAYHLLATAHYSTTEMDLFAAEGYGISRHHHAAQATLQQAHNSLRATGPQDLASVKRGRQVMAQQMPTGLTFADLHDLAKVKRGLFQR